MGGSLGLQTLGGTGVWVACAGQREWVGGGQALPSLGWGTKGFAGGRILVLLLTRTFCTPFAPTCWLISCCLLHGSCRAAAAAGGARSHKRKAQQQGAYLRAAAHNAAAASGEGRGGCGSCGVQAMLGLECMQRWRCFCQAEVTYEARAALYCMKGYMHCCVSTTASSHPPQALPPPLARTFRHPCCWRRSACGLRQQGACRRGRSRRLQRCATGRRSMCTSSRMCGCPSAGPSEWVVGPGVGCGSGRLAVGSCRQAIKLLPAWDIVSQTLF